MTSRPAIYQRGVEPLAYISVTSHCQNDCVFCGLRKYGVRYQLSLQEVREQLEQLHTDADLVIFTGGEPLSHPDILEILRAAKRVGYGDVIAFTCAMCVREEGFANDLVEAGLSGAMVSLHGCTAETHDRTVRRSGAFEQTLRGLELLAGQEIDLVVNTPVSSLNVGEIVEMYDFLAVRNLGIRRWQLSNIFPTAAVMDDPGIMPAYEEVREVLFEVLTRAQGGHLPCFLQEFPLCVVYPHLAATRDLDDQRQQVICRRDPHGNYRRYRPCTSPYKSKLPACESCEMKEICTGVPLSYLLSHRNLDIFEPLVGLSSQFRQEGIAENVVQ